MRVRSPAVAALCLRLLAPYYLPLFDLTAYTLLA